MNSEAGANNSLRELEQEVEAEGREWMRQRLEARLQQRVEKDGAIFPPQRLQGTASAPGDDAVKEQLRRGGPAGVARKGSS